jgi:hypothetical protein
LKNFRKVVSKIKKIIINIADKLLLGIEKKIHKKKWLAHHVIQRSGTNFLLALLNKHNLRIINRHNTERHKPGHKHFRWYEDKSLIPKEIFKQYCNNCHVFNIQQLNNACNFPSDTKHIVIYKKDSASLVSLLNWGLRVKWFNSKEEAVSSADRFLKDIREYYKFWISLSKTDPQKVQLISYEHLVKDNTVLKQKLIDLAFNVEHAELTIDEVPQSPLSRRHVISFKDVEHLF